MPDQTIEGRIDDHGQPVISLQLSGLELQLSGLENPVVALIDTGFNRELIIYEEHARQAQLVIEFDPQMVALADGSQKGLLKSEGTIEWFGEQLRIVIFIIPGPAPRRGRWQIGTQLLRNCKLEINFRERSVQLSYQV